MTPRAFPRTWHGCGDFCDFLRDNGYMPPTESGRYLSEGMLIYMYEAYQHAYNLGCDKGQAP